MANVIYCENALRDLEGIGDYIAEVLSSPTAALNTVNRIQNAIDKLCRFPLSGMRLSVIYDDIEADDYRVLVCGKYLAFYRPVEDTVYIDRILYGKRDYITILFGELPEEAE